MTRPRAAPRAHVFGVTAIAAALALAAAGCGAGISPWRGRFEPPGADDVSDVSLMREDRVVEVRWTDSSPSSTAHPSAPPAAHTARLGATIIRPTHGSGPGVVVVPGSGDVSRRGARSGDGTRLYARPVDVSTAWAEALAQRGAHVLLYDKRTCGPKDDARCNENPQHDVDAVGPVALARDVDAACTALRADPRVTGDIILLAHGQAGQVALASSCARTAQAIVLVSPIPRAVDQVIVAGLRHRHEATVRAAREARDAQERAALEDGALKLRNLAATREAEFSSMTRGRFSRGARVGGATVDFWKGWVALTARTPELVAAARGKLVVVQGGADTQQSPADQRRARAWAPSSAVEVDGADHHLLSQERLAPTTVARVAEAIDRILASTPPRAPS